MLDLARRRPVRQSIAFPAPADELLLGGAKLNAVNVAVNWRLAPPEVSYIVNDAGAKVFVVGEAFVPVLDAIAADLWFDDPNGTPGHRKHLARHYAEEIRTELDTRAAR